MGVAGAPKVGEASAWVDRIKTGMASMSSNAINGYQGPNGVMPAKGGNMSLSDEEVSNAVAFMVESSQ
jgi:cytochrome c5